MKRRNFIKSSSLIGAGLTVNLPIIKNSQESKLKVAIIGSGLRGQSHISLLLKRNDCDIVGIAEPDAEMIKRSKAVFDASSKSIPKIYDQSDEDYLRMLDTEKPDLAIISTPWSLHTEMAIACLNRNIYTGLEVSGAFSIEECWQLVHAAEASDSKLYFLENVCFRRDVMAVLNMVRKGLFGELIHLEGGYQHDLRGVKFNDGKTAYNSGVEFGSKGFSEARWRTKHSANRNGDLYPTHGIGPVAQMININRGNRFVSLNSMSSKSRGLHNYIINHPKGGKDHPNATQKWKLGDKVTTMIQCANGETIVLHHDTNLPRPYSLGFRVQGEKGLWMDVNKSLHIEGISPAHRWESQESYFEKYDHPLWQKWHQKAVGAGHGGMDYFLINSLVEHAKLNKEAPFDACDAATWMAITPLSEKSIATGSSSQAFPDFTQGEWIDRTNQFAIDDSF